MTTKIFLSPEPARHDARRAFDPAELRPEFQDPEFWADNAPKFAAFAADVASRNVRTALQDPLRFVSDAITLILDGERPCGDDDRPLRFVLETIGAVILAAAVETPEEGVPRPGPADTAAT